MSPDPPQLRLVRTRGKTHLLQCYQNIHTVQVQRFHRGEIIIVRHTYLIIFSCLCVSVLQEFGRGRTLTSRCDFSENLQKRGCDVRFIEYPTSSIQVLQNMPLSSKGSGSTQYDVVQIMPQKISLSLRPGNI